MNDDSLSAYSKKECGLKVTELSVKVGIPTRTLYDWWADDRQRAIRYMIAGVRLELQD